MNDPKENGRSSATSILIRSVAILIALISVAYTFNRIVIHQDFEVQGHPTSKDITE